MSRGKLGQGSMTLARSLDLDQGIMSRGAFMSGLKGFKEGNRDINNMSAETGLYKRLLRSNRGF